MSVAPASRSIARMSSALHPSSLPTRNIVTLTLNPAVDLAAEVKRIEPAHKLRCTAPLRDAGGGGINVARAIRRLGGDALAIYLAGGHTGAMLDDLMRNEGISFRSLTIGGETRESFSITERSSQAQYRFVLPGPTITANEANAALEVLASAASGGGYVVASGSLPPGLDHDFYSRVGEVAARQGARFVLDTSGTALKNALGPNLFLIKPSRRELAEIEGRSFLNDEDCLVAARRIVANSGASLVAVSLGDAGAILVSAGLAFRAHAPKVKAVSSVGAGDSFVAALVFELSRAREPQETLRSAVAAGTASLLSPGTGLFGRQDFDRLVSDVHVESLNRSPAAKADADQGQSGLAAAHSPLR